MMAGPWEQYQQRPGAQPVAPGPWSNYQKPTAAPERMPDVTQDTIVTPNVMARVGRGFMDVGQGMKQLWLMATDPEAAKKYTQEVNAEIALYEKGRGKDSGTDWARLGGNVAASAPAMLVPGGQAVSLGTRAASSAVGGALANGAMFSEDGTWSDKGAQAATGAAFGAAVPVAVQGAIKAGSGVVNKIYDKGAQAAGTVTGAFSPTQINVTLQQTLAGRGIDFGKLSAEARTALAEDVRNTLKAGGAVNADDLERKAAILAVGAKPTQAMVSRDPKRWAFERNTADINGVGDRLKARFMENNQAFTEFAGKLQKATGGQAADQYAAADAALGTMRAADKAAARLVSGLYDTAKATLGADAEVPMQPLAQKLGELMDEAPSLIPGDIKTTLSKYGLLDGKQSKVFTINDSENLIKQINRFHNPADPAQARVLGELRSAVEASQNELANVGNVIGEQSAGAFRAARSAAKDRFKQIESIPGLKAAVDGVEPDKFFGKYVLRGNASDVKAMGEYLQQANPAAWADVRSQTVQWLIDKATNGKGSEGQFSGTAFRRALDSLGLQRQQALFSTEEIAQLHTLQKAASAGTETPAFTKAGIGSNTAEKLVNMLNKASNVPYLRELLINPVKSTVQDAQVSRTLGGMTQSAGRSVPPLVSQYLQDAIANGSGRASVPLSVLINGAATR